MLFVISGPSGGGKTTLCKHLLNNKKLGLIKSISFTSRPPRREERPNKDYIFINEKEFKKKIKNKEILEWQRIFGYLYGTPRRFIEENLKKGKDILLVVDVKGAEKIKKFYPQAISIFILPPSFAALEKRLKRRSTESKEELKLRLERARKEMEYLTRYKYLVINNRVKEAVDKLKKLIITERLIQDVSSSNRSDFRKDK